tara:strand:- start:200 stop:475 length:276 start_codon:yes stop_codon:yes gene_type:complete
VRKFKTPEFTLPCSIESSFVRKHTSLVFCKKIHKKQCIEWQIFGLGFVFRSQITQAASKKTCFVNEGTKRKPDQNGPVSHFLQVIRAPSHK